MCMICLSVMLCHPKANNLLDTSLHLLLYPTLGFNVSFFKMLFFCPQVRNVGINFSPGHVTMVLKCIQRSQKILTGLSLGENGNKWVVVDKIYLKRSQHLFTTTILELWYFKPSTQWSFWTTKRLSTERLQSINCMIKHHKTFCQVDN